MLKIYSRSAKRTLRSIFLLLPYCLIFVLGMSSSPWAHGGEANVAYFAGGCFWCTEAVFQRVPGMTSVASGYMQGAETIQITFDPTKTRYEKLLNMFWRAHNPTEVDSQGPDVGRQYRSAIFYVDEQQRGVHVVRGRQRPVARLVRVLADLCGPVHGALPPQPLEQLVRRAVLPVLAL